MGATSRTREHGAASRRLVAFALLAGAVTMVVAAALIYVRIIPTSDDVRLLLIGVLTLVAAVDVAIGVKFLLASQ